MQSMMMPVLSPATIDDLYPRYADAWEVIVQEASARHRLTFEVFREEMLDPRLEKHVVIDEHGRVVAMTTMTTDLDAVPWINPTFYQDRFPAEYANGTLFYLGYTFVDLENRGTRAFALMAATVNSRLSQARGVIGFDICGFSLRRGIGRHLERLFSGSDILTADTQTYFIADYRTPRQRSAIGYQLSTLAERPDLVEDVRTLLAKQWPAYTLVGDAGHGVDLEALLLGMPEHQLVLLDEHQTLCCVGLSLPLRWDGTVGDLPAGWDDAIVSADRVLHHDIQPDTLCVLSITVAPSQTRRGLAERMITALKRRAADIGAHAMIAPVRPAHKSRYPLIPMAEYIGWTQSDGQSFDPWLRLHLRLGGEVATIAPESMTVTGSVVDWENWLGTPIPGSGDYIIDGGLAPLRIDRSSDQGTYVEPNVWVCYPISG